jgi:Tol biopolymer transport system component
LWRKLVGNLLAWIALLLSILSAVGLAFPVRAQEAGEIAHLGANGTVWLTDAEDEETEQLTERDGFSSLDWSADGKRLLLVSGGPRAGAPGEIYVLDAKDREAVKVADGYAPVWSSDGGHILYVSNFTASEEGTEQSLVRYDLESGTDRVLVSRRWVSGIWPIERVQYSGDEQLIAVYVAGLELEGQIVIVDSGGNTVWEIADFVYSDVGFDWSTDSQELVYRDSGQPFMGGEEPSLKIVRPDTQETRKSFEEAGFWPRWSPDGERIAALLWAEGGGFQVMVVDAPAGELALLSEEVFGDLWNSELRWSPDSSSLLFTSVEDGQGRVHVMGLDGGVDSIAEGHNPMVRWSPDGAHIAMAVGEGEGREIFVMGADGSGLQKVADGGMPAWRPVTEAEPGPARVCGLPLIGSAGMTMLVLMVVRTRHHQHEADGLLKCGDGEAAG